MAIKTISNNPATILEQYEKLSQIDHPVIPKVEGCIILPQSQQAILIMEYIEGETLLKYIEENRRLTEQKARALIKQLAEAIQLLHNQNILFKNLNLSNIMVTSMDSCSFKVMNIGIFKNKENQPRDVFQYFAPEVLTKKMYESASDIWQIGVVLFAILFGRLPFERETEEEAALSIVQGSFIISKRVSSELSDLFNKIFTLKIERRITLSQLLEHSWLNIKINQININWKFRFSQNISCLNSIQPNIQKVSQNTSSSRKKDSMENTMKSTLKNSTFNRNTKLHSLVRGRAQSQVCLYESPKRLLRRHS